MEIVQSRVNATTALATAIADADVPPTAWVSASAVGIYGDRAGDVVDAWERATGAALAHNAEEGA